MSAEKPALAGASFPKMSIETRQPESNDKTRGYQGEPVNSTSECSTGEREVGATSPQPISLETLTEGAGDSVEQIAVDYYDSNAKQYLVKNLAGRWLPHAVSDYKRILRSRGFRNQPLDGELLAETDVAILDVQDHRDVVYHGLSQRLRYLSRPTGKKAPGPSGTTSHQ